MGLIIPTPPESYSRREAMAVLVVVVAVTLALSLVVVPLGQVADPVRRSFGIDDVQFSYLLGALSAIPTMIMTVLGGWLADRVSRRYLLMGAMLVWTAGGVWCALAQSYTQLATARVLIATASGIKFPLVMAWLSDAYPPERRGRAIGAVFVFIGISPAIGAFLSGLVLHASQQGLLAGLPGLARLEPWRIAVLLLALCSLMVVPWIALLRDARQPVAPKEATTMTAYAGRPLRAVTLVMMAAAVLTFADNANLGWLPTVLSRQHGFDAQQVGFTFGLIVTLAGCIGPLLGGGCDGWIYRRYHTPGRLLACGVAALLCAPLPATFLSSNAHALIGALIVSGILTMSIMTLNFVALQSLLPPGRRGLGVGIAQALTNVAAALGPTTVAWVSASLSKGPESLGRGVGMVTIAAFLLTAACSLLSAGLLPHRPGHAILETILRNRSTSK